jgi:hypothetical protein
MSIAGLSTLISSIALIGVAISLLLQARQLRANQLQIAHTSQLELMKTGLDNPSLLLDLGSGPGTEDPVTFTKYVLLNWRMTHFSMLYDLKATSNAGLRVRAEGLFTSDLARKWWGLAGPDYLALAVSRRQRKFFDIVDGAFQQACLVESGRQRAAPPDSSASTPPPSS